MVSSRIIPTRQEHDHHCGVVRPALPNELKLHIGRGLDNGLSKEEVSVVIMHMAIYGGFPVAVEGMGVAREVFEAAD